jgi:aspartate/tyrosine/aromatic aminotransferase
MFESLATAPDDPILGLAEAFRRDPRPGKIDLGVGVFQDDRGETPTPASVRRAEALLLERGEPKAYLPIEGSPEFGACARALVFGAGDSLVGDGRAVTVQSLGGTGALRLAADCARVKLGLRRAWLSDPTWTNHAPIFEAAGLAVEAYPYYDREAARLRHDEMLDGLARAGEGDLVVLQPCCHNPTGLDPGPEHWEQVARLAAERRFLPLFDFAYQGFGEGVEADAGPVRAFAARGLEMFVCSSFSKNFGLYGERVGALTAVARDAGAGARALGQLRSLVRGSYSSPPRHGAALVVAVLSDPDLAALWRGEVDAMRERLGRARRLLAGALAAKRLGRGFDFLARQRGMFSLTGLSPEQVDRLRERHGVYAVRSGRINVAGVREASLGRLCDAIADVLA